MVGRTRRNNPIITCHNNKLSSHPIRSARPSVHPSLHGPPPTPKGNTHLGGGREGQCWMNGHHNKLAFFTSNHCTKLSSHPISPSNPPTYIYKFETHLGWMKWMDEMDVIYNNFLHIWPAHLTHHGGGLLFALGLLFATPNGGVK